VATGDELRAVMRRYPAGVSIVSVDSEGERLATTMGSLVVLSLEPPLVGVSVGKQNALHELLRRAGSFGVSIPSAEQEDVASRFARGLPPIAIWEGVALHNTEGPPLLEGALGWLRCSVWAEYEAGDHTLFVGEVESAELGTDGRPLVYLQSAYHAV
jgi:flavin reductase (DIM6/NTAB) family NADH-FMN oxidoreductase RutF